MARAVGIVLALGAEKKAIQPLVLAHGVDAIEPAGGHFVHVALGTGVKNDVVFRRGEDAVERDRRLDHPEVRTATTAGSREMWSVFSPLSRASVGITDEATLPRASFQPGTSALIRRAGLETTNRRGLRRPRTTALRTIDPPTE